MGKVHRPGRGKPLGRTPYDQVCSPLRHHDNDSSIEAITLITFSFFQSTTIKAAVDLLRVFVLVEHLSLAPSTS